MKDHLTRHRLDTLKDLFLVTLLAAVLYGILFALGFTCPVKAVTGISCPGCGMTRAYLSLLRLNLPAAWSFHPLFLVPPVWLAAYWFRDRRPLVYKIVTAGAAAAFLIVYAIRMMDPADQVVVFAPRDGLLFRFIAIGFGRQATATSLW